MSINTHKGSTFYQSQDVHDIASLFVDSRINSEDIHATGTDDNRISFNSQSKPNLQHLIRPSSDDVNSRTPREEYLSIHRAQMRAPESYSHDSKSSQFYGDINDHSVQRNPNLTTVSRAPVDIPPLAQSHRTSSKLLVTTTLPPPVRIFRGTQQLSAPGPMRVFGGPINKIPQTPYLHSTFAYQNPSASGSVTSRHISEGIQSFYLHPEDPGNEQVYPKPQISNFADNIIHHSTGLKSSATPLILRTDHSHPPRYAPPVLPLPPENLYRKAPRRATRTPKKQTCFKDNSRNIHLARQPAYTNPFKNPSYLDDQDRVPPIENVNSFNDNNIYLRAPMLDGESLYDGLYDNFDPVPNQASKDMLLRITENCRIEQSNTLHKIDTPAVFNPELPPLHPHDHLTQANLDYPPHGLNLPLVRNNLTIQELHKRLFETSVNNTQARYDLQRAIENHQDYRQTLERVSSQFHAYNPRGSVLSNRGIYSLDPNQLIAPTVPSAHTEEVYDANHQYWECRFANICPIENPGRKPRVVDLGDGNFQLPRSSAGSLGGGDNNAGDSFPTNSFLQEIQRAQALLPFKPRNQTISNANMTQESQNTNNRECLNVSGFGANTLPPPIPDKTQIGTLPPVHCTRTMLENFNRSIPNAHTVIDPNEHRISNAHNEVDDYLNFLIPLERPKKEISCVPEKKTRHKPSLRIDPLHKAKIAFGGKEVSPGAKRIENFIDPPKPQKYVLSKNPVIYLKYKNRYNHCYHENPWVNAGLSPSITESGTENQPRTALEELKKVMPLGKVQGKQRFDTYMMQRDLGFGANGVVKESLIPLKKPGTYLAVAIKTCSFDTAYTDENEYILREIAIMNRMRHKRIIQIYEVCLLGKVAKLAIELMACSIGRLASAMEEPMQENMAMRITRDALEGLAYLHSRKYIHRDIKCDNMMIDWGGVVKIGDFGLAIPFNKIKRGVAGTFRWMAPEVISKERYDSRADIWSLGISLIEMMDRLPPYGNSFENAKELENHIICGPTPFYMTFDPTIHMRNITKSMLTRDPHKRPRAKDLLSIINGMFDRGDYAYVTSQVLADTVKTYILPSQTYLAKKAPVQQG